MSYHDSPADRAQHAVKHLLSMYPEISQGDLCDQVSVRLEHEYGLSQDSARIEALKAVADEEARGVEAHLDLDKSTAYCLFVRTASGTHALSITQIMSLLEQPA